MLVFVIAAHLSTPLNTREPSGDLPVPMAVTGAVWAIAARMAELELTATFSQECNVRFATKMWRPPQSLRRVQSISHGQSNYIFLCADSCNR
jgi:phage-related protein